MHRRTFLRRAAAASAAIAIAPLGCGGGSDEHVAQPVDDPDLAHVLVTASHDRLYVKLSLHVAPEVVPVLRVDGDPVRGIPTDTAGRFWAFDARDLLPHHTHVLALVAGKRRLSPTTLRRVDLVSARARIGRGRESPATNYAASAGAASPACSTASARRPPMAKPNAPAMVVLASIHMCRPSVSASASAASTPNSISPATPDSS